MTIKDLRKKITLLKLERADLEYYADFPEATSRINEINAEIKQADQDIETLQAIEERHTATKEVA